MLVRAHNTIRARYVSSAYTMHEFEMLYVTMLLQLFVRPIECPHANLHKFKVPPSRVDFLETHWYDTLELSSQHSK